MLVDVNSVTGGHPIYNLGENRRACLAACGMFFEFVIDPRRHEAVKKLGYQFLEGFAFERRVQHGNRGQAVGQSFRQSFGSRGRSAVGNDRLDLVHQRSAGSTSKRSGEKASRLPPIQRTFQEITYE